MNHYTLKPLLWMAPSSDPDPILRPYIDERRLFQKRYHLMPTKDSRRTMCGEFIHPVLTPRRPAKEVTRDEECDRCHWASRRPKPEES